MKIVIQSIVAAAVSLVAPFANAADLPSAPPAYRAPVVVPVYNWTGMYLGINGGYGWGSQNPLSLLTNQFDKFDFDINGWMVGGTFGAQIQSGHVVLGIEGDIDWTNIKGAALVRPAVLGLPVGYTANLSTEINTVSTIRMRVGYAVDNWMAYGTGGIGLLGGKTTTSLNGATCGSANVLPCSGSGNRVGIAAGAGLEYGFTPNWSAKFEYLWIGAGAIQTAHINTVRGGLNYRFGGN